MDEAAAGKTLGYREAVWLATMGGAHALGLQVRLSCHVACIVRQPTRASFVYTCYWDYMTQAGLAKT